MGEAGSVGTLSMLQKLANDPNAADTWLACSNQDYGRAGEQPAPHRCVTQIGKLLLLFPGPVNVGGRRLEGEHNAFPGRRDALLKTHWHRHCSRALVLLRS